MNKNYFLDSTDTSPLESKQEMEEVTGIRVTRRAPSADGMARSIPIGGLVESHDFAGNIQPHVGWRFRAHSCRSVEGVCCSKADIPPADIE
jgi:hypothetical protein